jgi:hypothetical protein
MQNTYMMHIQSNMYDATSFMDGTPIPRTVLMVASEGSGDSKGEGQVRTMETGA